MVLEDTGQDPRIAFPAYLHSGHSVAPRWWPSWHLAPWKHTCLPAGCSGPSGLGLVRIRSDQFYGLHPTVACDLSWKRIKAERSCLPFSHHSVRS